jgi:hypothetical protein
MISLPLNNWEVLGSAIEVSPGQFQFADTQATGNVQRFSHPLALVAYEF